jgi:Glycosyl transferase family 2
VSMETIERGVTVVMPAYREEANLAGTVEDMLGTLGAMGEQHVVVIVNDGSDDRTGEVADTLAATYPGRVHVVHHEVNKGYGAAVRTGIATALEYTDAPWLFLTDSDGQFRAAELPWFVSEARTERADAVIGFRPRRADPMMRKVNAWLWTRASRLLLGVGARDVDCAYKLVGRRVLDGVQLHGDAALISPELLMNIRARDARILQRPVQHYPRLHGEQTGANLSVIIASLIGLIGLSLTRMRESLPGRMVRSVTHPRDVVCAALTGAAAVASVVAYLVFSAQHVLLAYPEAVRGLLIARRLSEGLPLGPALGSVWLPLWHVLAAATAWNDTWYYAGLSGSVLSMVAYVVATRYLYLTAVALTGNRPAGVTAAVVFAANPNVLYLQSTPSDGLLLMACAAAVAYHLTLWCQHGSYRQLAAAAAAALLASLTSYLGWALLLAAAVIVWYAAWTREAGLPGSDRLRHAEAHLVFYGLPALTGVAGWLAWNTARAGNPLHFLNGASVAGSQAPAARGLGGALITAARAIADGVGTPVLALAVVGLCYYLATTRLRPQTVAPLALLVFVPFTAYAAHLGASPGVAAASVAVALPAALFSGYIAVAVQHLAGAQRRASRQTTGYALLGIVVAAVLALTFFVGSGVLREAKAADGSAAAQADARAGAWLGAHYRGGLILMQSAGNEPVLFDSRVPLGQIVDEDSSGQWQRALANPAADDIRWIYMRRPRGGPDAVWLALHGRTRLVRYTVVYSDRDRVIYREG